jgi:DNA mismatch repair protein MutS
VAKLAGLPVGVVVRAGALLESLSVSHGDSQRASRGAGALAGASGSDGADGQLSLFREYLDHPAIAELKGLDLDRLSPMQAFEALRALQARASDPSPSAKPTG